MLSRSDERLKGWVSKDALADKSGMTHDEQGKVLVHLSDKVVSGFRLKINEDGQIELEKVQVK